jgi:hypothetical protein
MKIIKAQGSNRRKTSICFFTAGTRLAKRLHGHRVTVSGRKRRSEMRKRTSASCKGSLLIVFASQVLGRHSPLHRDPSCFQNQPQSIDEALQLIRGRIAAFLQRLPACDGVRQLNKTIRAKILGSLSANYAKPKFDAFFACCRYSAALTTQLQPVKPICHSRLQPSCRTFE